MQTSQNQSIFQSALLEPFSKWPRYNFKKLFDQAMNHSVPNRKSFCSVSNYQQECHPQDLAVHFETKEKAQLRETQQDEKYDSFLVQLYKRDQEDFPSQEISFQKNFLAQHKKALGTILWKSKESPITPPQPSKLSTPSPHLSPSKHSSNSSIVSSFIISLQSTCIRMLHDQFIKDLKRQSDLNLFLEQVIGSCEVLVAAALVAIAIDTWSEVRNKNLKDYEMRDFIKMGASLTAKKAQAYFNRDDFSLFREQTLPSPNDYTKAQLFQKFKEKLRCYITTVLLIVGGFFENPYASGSLEFQDNDDVVYPKRQFFVVDLDLPSSSEFFLSSQCFAKPNKKVKKQ